MKFGRENVTIDVRAGDVTQEIIEKHELDKSRQYVAITVTDNGMGFDQQYISKLFGLFQRLHTIKGIDGSGVGLALCKRIVQDHQGLILATGKEIEGATFTVILPK